MANVKSDTISATYRPGPGDAEQTEAFGTSFRAGEAVEVSARFADKLRGNPYFEVNGEKTHGDDMREQKPEEIEETSFEENVARERAAEYLDNPRQFHTSEPGAADRVARGQELARELQEARSSDDVDKPRRGRPPKDK